LRDRFSSVSCSQGLVLPTVIFGVPIDRGEALNFHAAEVQSAQDQIEAASVYSVDAGDLPLSTTRQNNDAGRSSADQSAAAWNFSDRLKKRLGYTGLLTIGDPSRFST